MASDLKRLREEKEFEVILGVGGDDATQEDLDKGLLKFRKEHKDDEKVLRIGSEAYSLLSDKGKRKELVLWRWFKDNGFSVWEENRRQWAINRILRDSTIQNYSYSNLNKFLGMEKILEILEIKPVEAQITKDEQINGCTLTFGTTTVGATAGKISVSIHQRVTDDKIIIIREGVIKVKVIPADASEIYLRFIVESGIPTSLIKKPAAIEFIRDKLKYQWTKYNRINDQEIIDDMKKTIPNSMKPKKWWEFWK